MQTDAMCLNRAIKYDLLQLQKSHATLHNDSAMAAKAQRKMNSLLAREYKSLLSDYMREKFCGKKDLPIWRNDRLITRNEKVLIRRSMEGTIGPGQILRRAAKSTQKYKTKESRKKQITLEMTQAEIEFEKARLKKLENEEKRKEDNLKNIKPKKKGPKTHFKIKETWPSLEYLASDLVLTRNIKKFTVSRSTPSIKPVPSVPTS